MVNLNDKQRETLAILVGGGPAPGISSVISARMCVGQLRRLFFEPHRKG
jgi:hypothetical protein